MNMDTHSRRHFVKNAAAGLGLLTLPALLNASPGTQGTKKKIVCVGAHPDDPESGCGGTLARLAAEGHEVTIIYLTTGEAGIANASHQDAANTRRQEAINACKIINAKPVFAGQIDGATIADNNTLSHLHTLITSEQPDVVFTHWPVDSHKDHQIASLLTIQTWLHATQKFALYFFEVCAGEQTMLFNPTDYVDIGGTQEQKKKAVYCHVSQDPPGIYACGHTAMEDFRGREAGVSAAEAFVRMTGKGMGMIAL
ncbi:MAG TPA: PIG-L deacetylase family protein [Mucilaginibacter sp.]|nr:PIG-L deacetylase family protein [Mucilaginibacter sp.]